MILRIGSQGDQVKWLQKQLRILDDGWFGIMTDKAVKQFQLENDLTPDGIVGPKTYEKLGVKSEDPNWICLHVSATPENAPHVNADWVKHLHMGVLKWDRPGYHYVIERDGTLVELWKADLTDGLQSNETTHGIGGWRDSTAVNICLIGGLDTLGRIKDTRTPEQRETLEKLVKSILKETPKAKVVGHNQFWNKACPCFSVPKYALSIGIDQANIETQDPFGYTKAYNA